MHNLKINLFGEQWTLHKVYLNTIEKEYFNNIAFRLKLPLHKALLDPFFYYHLRLNSIPSLDKLPGEKISGLLNSNKNQIEIWLDGKKIRKLKIEELNQDQYLFPLYNTTKSKIENTKITGIYIEQKEIGFIGSYEFKIENFKIENLQFNLIELDNQLLLQNITYPNCKTIFKKKETVLNYQNSYYIEDNSFPI
jgi:hypothetical protein